MDNKTMLAKFVADETVRLNNVLKEKIARGEKPSEEENDALLQDMEATFGRLQQALLQIHAELKAEEDGKEEVLNA